MKKTLIIITLLFVRGLTISAQNTWIQKADFGDTSRHGAIGFNIYGKGYIGTGSDYNEYYKDFWEYDPDLDVWTQKADFGGGVRFSAIGFSIGSKGYIGTGRDDDYNSHKDFWEYDPDNNTWEQKADFGGNPRFSATGFSIGNKGYIGTGGLGLYSGTHYDDFWEFDPVTNTWTVKADFAGGARYDAAGFSIGGKGYLGTGFYFQNNYTYYYQDFWQYDPITNTWIQKTYFSGNPRYDAIGFSIGSKGYLGTGSGDYYDGYYKDFWEYDPGNNTWIQQSDFGGSARFGAVGYSIGSKGYVGTGYDDASAQNDFWEYTPECTGFTIYADADGDSYGDINNSYFAVDCIVPTGYVITDSTDCNDNNSGVHPGTCDGTNSIDDNCNGVIDDGSGTLAFYPDADGDGYGDPNSLVNECSQPSGYLTNSADCNDEDSSIHPGVIEICNNGIDENCYGQIDENCGEENSWVQKSDFGYDIINAPAPLIRSGAVSFSIGSKGYMGTGAYMNDFWEYDPDADMWTQKADFGGIGRLGAVGFSIGNKGYLGTGRSYDYNYYKDFWEYDPNANTWTQKADFGGTARYIAVSFSIESKGYLGTGYDGGYKKDFWEYDPNADTWTQKADFGGTARYEAVGLTIGGKGYIGTGYNGSYQKDFWEYDPGLNTWIQKADFGATARYLAVGFSINGKGYLGTGSATDGYKKDFWEYDPDADTWMQKADFGGSPLYYATGFSIGNNGYVGTGYANSDFVNYPYKGFWEYNSNENVWTQKIDFSTGGRSGASGFSIGKKGYLGTGYDGGYKNDFWEYDPEANAWTQKSDFGGDARSNAVGFSIGSKGYMGTGYYRPTIGLNYNYADIWEYDPTANTWIFKGYYIGGGVHSATGFSIGDKGYVGTGGYTDPYYGDLELNSNFIEYDPVNNTWTPKSSFAGGARAGVTGIGIGNKGYIGTGYDDDFDTYKDWWEYDPLADVWTKKADFGGNARSEATGFSIGSKGYIGTGGYDDFWEYDPAIDTWMSIAECGGGIRSDAVGFRIGTKGYAGTGTSTNDFWEHTPAVSGPICNIPTWLSTGNISSSTAKLKWDDSSSALGYKVRYKIAGTPDWTKIQSINNNKTLHDLSPNTTYAWQVKSICGVMPIVSSDWSEKQFFTTDALRLAADHEEIFEVYPNPVSQSATVSFSLAEESSVVIEIMDVNGRSLRVIADQNFSEGGHEVTFSRESWIAGFYFLQLKTDDRVMMKKMLIE